VYKRYKYTLLGQRKIEMETKKQALAESLRLKFKAEAVKACEGNYLFIRCEFIRLRKALFYSIATEWIF
jgi:hypothetical protein